MTSETVVLTTADGPTPAFIAEPARTVRGGVLIVHEVFGLTDHITDVCRRFADAGWRAVAPDLYHRQGSPVFDHSDAGAALALRGRLAGDDILDDLDSGLMVLAESGTPIDRSAAVGFCMGGSIAFHAAVHRPLAAAVTFYGGGIEDGRFGEPSQLEVATSLQTPWLGLYGDLDPSTPVEQVEHLRMAVSLADVDTEIVRYPGVGHAFHNDARPDFYDAAAAHDAWARTLAWLEAHVPR
ncbi:carboxymethylenebutenolidase [Frankia sp. CcI49]|uniref:dienelactone hydrolase family protein n=1 Tax=unclassified Frankia TaxID=2632575 RepID=UPI0006CA2293|nr:MULTISPECIES: dienelactone hydrolase family protein [unclassified Frankia]KPM51213.1 carboxymethylenebutenolidase [Frankia sp. R43]ONH59557.1 carboxymethylenebutenolidase [Frankia sp. CcI49]